MLMLLFNIGNDLYALDTEPIIEIFPKIKLKKMPHMPEYVPGIVNYGGAPIPVVDLCELVEHRPSSNSLHTRIILVEISDNTSNSITLGLIGEKVTETEEFDPRNFIESGVQAEDLSFLGGVNTKGDRTIQLINLNKLIISLKGIVLS